MSDKESSEREEAQPGNEPDSPASTPAEPESAASNAESAPESDADDDLPARPPATEADASEPEPAADERPSEPAAEKPPSEPEQIPAAATPTDDAAPAPAPTPVAAPQARAPSARPAKRPARPGSRGREAPVFYVAGFFHRSAAAIVDLAVIVPVALLGYALVSRLGDVALPSSRHHGVDFWLDLLLAGDPALITLVALLVAVATIYVLVFQITLSHTPGMRLMKIRIVDQYGDPPSTARAAARTAGYVASAATLGLGFIWIGFDSEKRGLHDWLSGTYLVRA